MKKMIAIATSAAMLVSFSSSAGHALASEVQSAFVLKPVLGSSVSQSKVAPAVALVTPFSLYGQALLPTYDATFKLNRLMIKSIKNNAGNYSDSKIDKAIDGKMDTHWETNTPNSSSFTNEIVFQFNELTTLNRMVYAARQSGAQGKGFAQEFKIYGSTTDEGNDFTVVSTGQYKGSTGDVVEIQFTPTAFKRIKFVFVKANQDWASAAEVSFYKEDQVHDAVKDLFTDGTMSAVKPAYNTIDKINELVKAASVHPLSSLLQPKLELAKQIVKGELQTDGMIITAEQHGDMRKHASQQLRFGYGSNNQPTGLVAMPGDTINVYVDVDSNAKLPRLTFSQQEGSWSSWARGVQLLPGKNTIVVPEIPTNGAYAHTVTKGGPVYIDNPYTTEEQGQAPRIRFEGVERFPMMTKDTDPAEFKALLKSYKQKLDADKAAHPNVQDRKVIDVVEMVSDRIIFTGTATEAYKQFITEGQSPLDTLTGYDVWINRIFDLYGLDGRSENHDPKLIRENIRLMQPYGAMYAAGDHTGIQIGTVGLMLEDFTKVYPGWGLTHEIGHRMAVGEREYGEVTNNMLSMLISVDYNDIDTRIPFESDIYTYVIEENKVAMEQQGLFARLGAFWQLELAHPGYWTELNSLYRDRKVSLPNGDISKQQYLVEFSSEVLGMDLSSFFARHGFNVSSETKEKVSKYPASDKLWYLNNSIIQYEGTGITDNNASLEVDIRPNAAAKTNTLSFKIDEVYQQDVLGYEIYRNNTLVGFTGTNQFVDKNIDPTQNYTYRIVAIDKTLKPQNPVEVKAFKPVISVENNVTLKLNQAFDPMTYVKALNYQGQDITADVVVKSNNVDVTKKGNYTITYEIKSEGTVIVKSVNVAVTSNYDYVSDLNAASARVGWGTLKKDAAPAGSPITLVRQGLAATYTKGLGVHASSELVYNIEGKGYDFFESYIGIDQAMKGNNAASATFEVYVDGVKQFNSAVFHSGTEHEYVKIAVAGAKEIKLVTTDAKHNGNASDHTVWADAKFLISSSAPELTIPASVSTKVGQAISLQEVYSATDVEDGDITASVVVSGIDHINFNRAGEYPISYTVTDSDGNAITKTRTVAVVNMEDYTYLTDFNWKSTQNSYATPLKDVAISRNALRLTDNNNREVSYARGIGAHSNSTIVYDLSDKNYDYFTSYVGVDRHMFGSIGSVSFEVYVDGEKAYDSGLMNARDPQKYIEIAINGAKELKLVVTDGGNGNGSDHATWGDTKLHFANGDHLYKQDLEQVMAAAKQVDLERYTTETIERFLTSLTRAEAALAKQEVTQGEVDAALSELREAEAGLVAIDLMQVISVEDKYLSNSIKKTLGITGEITFGDMLQLTTLTSETRRARSLAGIEYARNLVTLDIVGNEITDFSPLKGLTKLEQLFADPQVIEMRGLQGQGGIVEVENVVKGIDGAKVIPYLAAVRHNRTFKDIAIDVSAWALNPDTFTLDLSKEEKGLYTFIMAYQVDGNLMQLIYMIDNK